MFSNSTASGINNFDQDAFKDITLEPTNNIGLTDNASTNPTGSFFGNDQYVRFGAKTFFIKDVVLVADTTKWINKLETYEVIFSETCNSFKAYVSGVFQKYYVNGQLVLHSQQYIVFTVTGVLKRAALISHLPITQLGTAAAIQVVSSTVDGGSTLTTDICDVTCNNSSNFTNTQFRSAHPKINKIEASSSSQTKDLHTFKWANIIYQPLWGLEVVFSEGSEPVWVSGGTSYEDKQKVIGTGSTFAPGVIGHSFGAVFNVYKTLSGGYTQIPTSGVTFPITTATGSINTNLLAVGTGHGASFTRAGVILQAGSSSLLASVTSVSTDTLTLSSDINIAATGQTLVRAFTYGSSQTISSTLYNLSYVHDFKTLLSLDGQYCDNYGRYNISTLNVGSTAQSINTGIALNPNSDVNPVGTIGFNSTGGYVQIDGYYQALELVLDTTQYAAAVVPMYDGYISVDGVSCALETYGYTSTTLGEGFVNRTLITNAHPGWHSVRIAQGASFSASINKINFYTLNKNIGSTIGMVGYYSQNQSVFRPTCNATLMPIGTKQRVYADNIYATGFSLPVASGRLNWTREVSSTYAGGVALNGVSNLLLEYKYYGRDFGIVGTLASGATLTLDGVGVPLASAQNTMTTGAAEGYHTISYKSIAVGTTSSIQAIDITGTYSEVKSTNAYSPLKLPKATESNPWISMSQAAMFGCYRVTNIASTFNAGGSLKMLGEWATSLRDANSNGVSVTNAYPTATLNVNNKITLYQGNAYTSADTNNEPTIYAFFIGLDKEVIIAPMLTTNSAVDISPTANPTGGDKGFIQYYDPLTGVFYIAGFRPQTGGAGHTLGLRGWGTTNTSVSPLYEVYFRNKEPQVEVSI